MSNIKLIYSNQNKEKNEYGWILNMKYLDDIQEALEKRGIYLEMEDIEAVLLVANDEAELL